MASRRFKTRLEMEEHHFHPVLISGVAVLAIFFTAYVPKLLPAVGLVDLPLIVVIYFSLSRRSAIAGTMIGSIVGLFQDTLSNQYIGVNGIAKSVVGYAAASVGLKLDVDNIITRTILNFALSLLHSVLFFVVERVLLGDAGGDVRWAHELLRAAVNTAVAVPVFLLLDQARVGE